MHPLPAGYVVRTLTVDDVVAVQALLGHRAKDPSRSWV